MEMTTEEIYKLKEKIKLLEWQNSKLRKFAWMWHSAFASSGYMQPVYNEFYLMKDFGILEEKLND